MHNQSLSTFARDTNSLCSVIRGVCVSYEAGIIREPGSRHIPIQLPLEILYDLMPRIWNNGVHNTDIMSIAVQRGTTKRTLWSPSDLAIIEYDAYDSPPSWKPENLSKTIKILR